MKGSCEALFHSVEEPAFWLDLRAKGDAASRLLMKEHLQRAIGVIYRPETERASHYFATRPAQQFDLVIHIDETRALEPLETTPQWESGEPPETFRFGE